MFSRVLTTAVAMVAMAFGLASPVLADFFTEQATVNASAQFYSSPAPPITQSILLDTGGGQVFSNTYGVDASGDALVRSVGVIVLNNINTAGNGTASGVFGPGATHTQLIVAFAVDGHTTGPGSPTLQFTSGGAGIWNAATNFTSADASKWFTNPNNLAGTEIWGSTLAPPTNVLVGNGDNFGGTSPGGLFASASTVNMTSIDAVNHQLIQGLLLFNESFDPNHFLDTTTNFQGGGLGGLVDAIAASPHLIIGTQQFASDLLNSDTVPAGSGTAAAKQSVVNNLAAFFGLSLLTSGGFSGNFATFGSNTDTDYRPGAAGLNSTDFAATANVALRPGLNSVIPEPSTFGLMAIGSAAIGFFARFRSSRKK